METRLQSRFGIWFSAILLSLLAVVTFAADQAQSQTGPAGYTVEYLDSWPNNFQLKYIRVVIKPIGGTSKDNHDFHVVARTTGNRSGTKVSTVVPIRKGDTSATGELFVPVSNGYNFVLHTELDGDLNADRFDYAIHDYYDYSNNYGLRMTKSTPPMVFASSEVVSDEATQFVIMNRKAKRTPNFVSIGTSDEFPSLDDLGDWYESTNVNFGGGRNIMSINGFTSPNVAAMSLESLPSRWFGYDGLGLVVVTFDDLKQLASKHPGKLLAIERWVAASGRLVVLNAGKDFENVSQSLKLLGEKGNAATEDRECTWPKSKVDQNELASALDVAKQEAQDAINSYGYNRQATIETTTIKQSVAGDLESGKLKDIVGTGKAQGFVSLDFEAGQLICVCDSASNWATQRPTNTDAWGALSIFLEATERSSQYSHQLVNSDTVRNFGFPEFVEPPRFVFEFSILAYLLAVGPFAFFFLKHKKKLNLMFVVVPIISALFCTAILAWAIFAEGFDTRVNQFTYTVLNQKTGRQVTSTISHVYSGMTPSPYQLDGPNYGLVNLPYNGRELRIQWDKGTERLSGGEVRARTNHQLFSRCSNETEGKLAFAFKGEGDSETASVRNDFETTVACVAFHSDSCTRNQFWVCTDIAPGEIAQAQKMKIEDAAKLIKGKIQKRGSATVYASGRLVGNSRSDRYGYYYGDEISSVETASVANQLHAMWYFSPSILRGLHKNEGSYFALTEKSTNHETAISNALMESEIHVIQGVR